MSDRFSSVWGAEVLDIGDLVVDNMKRRGTLVKRRGGCWGVGD